MKTLAGPRAAMWMALTAVCGVPAAGRAAPANDACADAIPIGEGSTAGTLIGATNDGSTSCGGSALPDVWYTFTAPGEGMVLITTCGTHDTGGVDQGMDTVLSVHTGCPGTVVNQIDCNDNWGVDPPPDVCIGLDQGLQRDSALLLEISAGETFWIRVSRRDTTPDGPFNLDVTFELLPLNDDCGDAAIVTDGQYMGTLEGATVDGSCSCQETPQADVWYRYTATASGVLVADTCGTNDMGGEDQGIDTVLSLHSACPGTELNQLDCNDDTSPCGGLDQGISFDSLASLPISAGETVFVRVSRHELSDDGPFALNIGIRAPPDNDDCLNAAPIGPGTYYGTTLAATNDGKSLCDCLLLPGDVWYVYESACEGDLAIDTCGSIMDTVVSVYTGCPGDLGNEIACNDDCDEGVCVGSFQSCVTVSVVPDEIYWIRVSSCGADGDFLLNLSFAGTPPANDVCTEAIPVGEGVLPFSTCGADTDGLPDPACASSGDDQVGSDVWFFYTPACDGTAEVNLCGSDFDTKLAVYDVAECLPPVSPIVCDDDSCGLQSAVSFPVVAGAPYLIRAGGYRGVQGEGLLEIQCLPVAVPRPVIIAIDDQPGDKVRIRFVEEGAAAAAYELERSALPETGFASDPAAVINPGAGYYDAETTVGPDARQFFRVKANH